MPNRYYLTTPIYYVNDVPHVGTSYTTVAADILARFHQSRGEEVLFATGTDENATKVVQAAEAKGMQPQPFVDGMAESFKRAWTELNVEYDVFIRTSEPRHKRAVQTFFQTLQDRGDIYQGPYEGWYCVACEQYYTEKELAPGNLCTVHQRPVEKVKEESYFFRLSAYQTRLQEFYDRVLRVGTDQFDAEQPRERHQRTDGFGAQLTHGATLGGREPR